MNEELVVKYIRRKNKRRKIITYKEGAELRKYHEAVVKYLRENTYDSIFAKAYKPGASIYHNAEAHMYNDIFIKMDIKDFFPSINHKYLEKALYREISLKDEISRYECHEIVEKCSAGERGLPLGLVSSPALANLYLKEFDGILYGKLKKMNLDTPIYTRYADDIVVSFRIGESDPFQEQVSAIVALIKSLLARYHLKANDKKTHIVSLYSSNHVRITGISIVKKEDNYRHLSIGRKQKNEIFWRAIALYDVNKTDYKELETLKGLVSFALSIEKTGLESIYSDKMMALLHERKADTIKELLDNINTNP